MSINFDSNLGQINNMVFGRWEVLLLSFSDLKHFSSVKLVASSFRSHIRCPMKLKDRKADTNAEDLLVAVYIPPFIIPTS